MKETTHVMFCCGDPDPEARGEGSCKCHCYVTQKDGKKYINPVMCVYGTECSGKFFEGEHHHLQTKAEYYHSLPDDPNDGVCY